MPPGYSEDGEVDVSPVSRPASIVVALPWEATPIAKHLGLRRDDKTHGGVIRYGGSADRVVLLQAGMGSEGAARAFAHLDKPAFIVSAGFCGGVGPGVALGNLVVASHVVRDTAAVPADPGLLETATRCLRTLGLAFHVGMLLTVDQVVDLTAEPWTRRTDLHILAVDMESAFLAEAAMRHGIPFLAMRAVSDTPAEPWAAHAKAFLNCDGHLKPGMLVASIVRHPSWIPRMLKLGSRLRQATRRLARGIATVLDEHPNPPPP